MDMYNVGEIATGTKFKTTNLQTVSIFKFTTGCHEH